MPLPQPRVCCDQISNPRPHDVGEDTSDAIASAKSSAVTRFLIHARMTWVRTHLMPLPQPRVCCHQISNPRPHDVSEDTPDAIASATSLLPPDF